MDARGTIDSKYISHHLVTFNCFYFSHALPYFMYQFYGHLGSPRASQPRYLAKLLQQRAKRLARWYAYIKRNKKLGQALAVLFGALELAIMEGVRSASKLVPSVHARFMRFLDGKWGSKIVPLNVKIDDVATVVLPSQQILEIAKRTPIRSLNWCYCYRTHGHKAPGQPDRYSCLALGWGQNVQAIVHQLIFFPSPDYFYIICACHPDFCLTLANTRKWGFPAVVKSDFIAAWDKETCQQCKTCLQRCHFHAMHENGGKIAYNPKTCVGCGLCVTKCPSGALSLKPRNASNPIA
jgi:ferredoxin